MEKATSNTIKAYLIRHGESTGMQLNLRLGANDPLSRNGRRQSEALGKRLSRLYFDFAYSSPSLRSQQTSMIVARYNSNLIFKELCELTERKEPTVFIGKQTDDLPWNYLKKHRLKRHWKFKDSESFDEIFKRSQVILDIFAKHSPKAKIIAVTHGSMIRAIVANVIIGKKLTPQQYYRMTEQVEIAPTGITVIELSQKSFDGKPSWKLLTWMDAAHLE